MSIVVFFAVTFPIIASDFSAKYIADLFCISSKQLNMEKTVLIHDQYLDYYRNGKLPEGEMLSDIMMIRFERNFAFAEYGNGEGWITKYERKSDNIIQLKPGRYNNEMFLNMLMEEGKNKLVFVLDQKKYSKVPKRYIFNDLNTREARVLWFLELRLSGSYRSLNGSFNEIMFKEGGNIHGFPEYEKYKLLSGISKADDEIYLLSLQDKTNYETVFIIDPITSDFFRSTFVDTLKLYSSQKYGYEYFYKEEFITLVRNK